MRPRRGTPLILPCAVIVALVFAILPASSAYAADDWTGMYVDGPDGEPLSGGLQTLYAPPAVDVEVTDTTADHSVIEISVADWVIRMEDRDGDPLAVRAYDSRPNTGDNGYHGMAVSGPGGTCPESSFGRFAIRELIWSGNDIARLAVDWQLICRQGAPLLAGAIRLASTLPIVGVANDPDVLDLGETTLGVPSTAKSIGFTSIGQTAVHFGTAYLDGNRQGDVEVVADQCSGATLDPGHSCSITVRMTGIEPAFEATPHIVLPEDTPRGTRLIWTNVKVRAATSITMEVDASRAYWPGPTYVSARITPPPDGGTVRFRYDDGHGTAGEFTETLFGQAPITGAAIVPRGTYDWTATFEGHGPYDPSTSPSVRQTTGLQTYVTLVPDIFPIAVGKAATFKAIVHPAEGLPVPPGTITLRNPAGTVVGTGPVGGDDDLVEFDIAGLGLGTHEFRASYLSETDGEPSSAAFLLGVTSTGLTQAWTAESPGPGDWITAIAPAPDGVFVAGRIADGEAGENDVDVFVARYGKDGTVLWVRQAGSVLHDDPIDLVATSKAAYLLYAVPAASWAQGSPSAKHTLVKYDLDGKEAWARSADVDSNSRGSLAPMPDGGIAVALTPPGPSTYPTNRPALLRVYRANGAVAWEDKIEGGSRPGTSAWAMASDVASDRNGVTLLASRTIDDDIRTVVRRYSLTGGRLWERIIGDGKDGVSASLIAANDQEIRVVGYSQRPITDTPNAFPAQNVFDRSYRFDGTVRWTRPLAPSEEVGQCGSFVTVGATGLPPESGLWVAPYVLRAGPTMIPQWRWEVTVDGDGYVEFRDVVPTAGKRAYVLRHDAMFGNPMSFRATVVALDGVPAPTDCDTRRPTTTAPVPTFRAGTIVGSKSVKVRVRWSGSDVGVGIARYRVEQRIDGKSWTTSNDILASHVDRSFRPGHLYRFRATPVDGAGNVGARASGPTARLVRASEASTSVSYVGRWTRTSSDSFLGGRARSSSAAGAKSTFRFVGRGVAWVATQGPNRGKAAIYVDGKRVSTVDLYAASTQHRTIVWTKSWSKSAAHRVTIKVLGTKGRPRVDVDGFLTLR